MILLLSPLLGRTINYRRLLEESGVKEGQTVLDFGCGPGNAAIPAAEMVGENGKVYDLDIHHLAIRSVEKKIRKKGITNIATILSDRDTGLPDESVDVTLLYGVFHMIKDRRALLSEAQRVAESDGTLSIAVGHQEVEDVIEIVEDHGAFYLKDRHDKLLNFNKK